MSLKGAPLLKKGAFLAPCQQGHTVQNWSWKRAAFSPLWMSLVLFDLFFFFPIFSYFHIHLSFRLLLKSFLWISDSTLEEREDNCISSLETHFNLAPVMKMKKCASLLHEKNARIIITNSSRTLASFSRNNQRKSLSDIWGQQSCFDKLVLTAIVSLNCDSYWNKHIFIFTLHIKFP